MVIATIAACSSQAPRQDENLANATVVDSLSAAANQQDVESTAIPGVAEDRAPLSEPEGAIDPKSAEAAAQVVQRFGALIEQKRFKEAAELWEDPTAGDSFAGGFSDYREIHLQVGKPGNMEGAAGSSYVEVPISLYGTSSAGAPFRCAGATTLRRVNDVPGSTARQRQWHIRSIEC